VRRPPAVNGVATRVDSASQLAASQSPQATLGREQSSLAIDELLATEELLDLLYDDEVDGSF